jgi:hypothetical protein
MPPLLVCLSDAVWAALSWTCSTARRIIGVARRIDRLTRCPGPYRSCISASRLDETKLAGNAAQKANRTLPQIEKILAEAPLPHNDLFASGRAAQGG